MAKNATIIKNRYDKKHMKQFLLKYHLENDADIIEKLSSVPNKQDYVRQLIREDLARTRTQSAPVSVPSTPFAVPTADVDDETRKAIEKELIRWLQWYKNQYGVDSIFI